MTEEPTTGSAARELTRLVNLTPHQIRIRTSDGEVTVDPSGVVARVDVTTEQLRDLLVGDVAVAAFVTSYERVTNVPAPENATVYVVSSPVAANSARTDLCVPFDLERDDEGNPLFCRGLAFLNQPKE